MAKAKRKPGETRRIPWAGRKTKKKNPKLKKTMAERAAILTAEDSMAIQKGKILAERIRRGGRYYVKTRIDDYKRQERLVLVAALIRKNKSHQQIINYMMKKYKISKPCAMGYLKRVYVEFQDRYTSNDRAVLMYEHLEALQQGAQAALENGQLMAYEKLRRQYAEALGIMVAPSTIQSTGNSHVNIMMNQTLEEQEGSNETLESLEKLSGEDLFRKLIDNGNNDDPEARLLESRTEASPGGGEEEGSVCGEASDDNEG